VSATSNTSNVKPIFNFLPHFFGEYRSHFMHWPLWSQKKESVGLRSGDLEGHSLMSFAVLSRNGEQDLRSILQLLHNLQSICEEMKIVSKDLPKIFLKNITSPNIRHLRTARKYYQSSTCFSLTGQGELLSLTDPATLHKTVLAKNIWLPCWVLPVCRKCLSAFTAPHSFFQDDILRF
jgi:hypothetical protein